MRKLCEIYCCVKQNYSLRTDEHGLAILIEDITMSSLNQKANGGISPQSLHVGNPPMINLTMNENDSNYRQQPQTPGNVGANVAHTGQTQMTEASYVPPAASISSHTEHQVNDSDRINRGLNYMAEDARQQLNGVTFDAKHNTIHRYNDTYDVS